MVQIIPKVSSFGEQFGRALGTGASQGLSEAMESKEKAKKLVQENIQIYNETGIDLRGINDPKMRQEALKIALQGQQKEKLLGQKQDLLKDIFGGQKPQATFSDQINGNKPEIPEERPSKVTHEPEEEFNVAKISDEQIAYVTNLDPALGRELRAAKDTALKEKRFKEEQKRKQYLESPEYLREKALTTGQATADLKYGNDLQERRGKQILKKESLQRLENMGKNKVTGKAYEKVLENMGLTALTSEGRRAYSAEAKNQFTDFKQVAGSQLSSQEFFVLAGAYPNADFSPEANQAIIDNLKQVHDTLDKEDEIAQKLKKENNGKTPENYQEKVNAELQKYSQDKIQKVKDNLKIIMNEQYAIPPGMTLMFDNNGEPLSVPEDKVVELLEQEIANLP